MRLVVLQTLLIVREMRVDLRRGDACVTEGILDVAEGHPPFEHMGRVRVPQSVRSNRLVEIGLARIILEDEPEPLTREADRKSVV